MYGEEGGSAPLHTSQQDPVPDPETTNALKPVKDLAKSANRKTHQARPAAVVTDSATSDLTGPKVEPTFKCPRVLQPGMGVYEL